MTRRNPRPGTDILSSETVRRVIHNTGDGGRVRLLKVALVKHKIGMALSPTIFQ